MATFNWKQFLTEYSQELASQHQYLDWAEVSQVAREAKWFGFAPATENEIACAEQSLGIQLPEDMRGFYRVTNGWMLCGHSIHDIRPVEELRWLSDGDPKLWELCEVDPEPPEDDDDEREWWYEQGIKVRRSVILNTRGDDATLLYDPLADVSANELRYGTWAAWNPAMEWTASTLSEFFQQSREALRESTDS